MKLDDTERCAGTRQPNSSAVIGLCYGCARYTLGPASLSALAYIEHEPPYTPVWTCDERRAVFAGHAPDAPPASGMAQDSLLGGAAGTPVSSSVGEGTA